MRLVPVLGRLRLCETAGNRLVCSQGTSRLRWSFASASLRDTHPCAECLGAALSPLSAGAFLELNAAKETFWFIASLVPPSRVSKEFLSAANDTKMNRHENILGTPTTSNM